MASTATSAIKEKTTRLFFCGDVMLARGIDMIQKQSCDPKLYEDNGLCAHDYVQIAKLKNGPIIGDRSPAYIWGDALKEFDEKCPDARVINLETSITTSRTPWPGKGIHYKMHPANVDILKAANVTCVSLANNHTADWGFEGLKQTLSTLQDSNIAFAGAGTNIDHASTPAICPLSNGNRLLVYGVGHQSSGVPNEWKATASREGLCTMDIQRVKNAVMEVASLVKKHKQMGDIAVLSIHWGGNWGFHIDDYMVDFAHGVIDGAEVDIVHGHSSHHVKAVEVYKGKVIMYGCGDFINDYEGIDGNESYRGDLALMYFVDVDALTGRAAAITMIPTQTKWLRVNHAKEEGVQWLCHTMDRECAKFGNHVVRKVRELRLLFDGCRYCEDGKGKYESTRL